MKRTTIFLDESTLLRLKRVAHRQGVTSAALMREAVTRYLDTTAASGGLPAIAGQFAGPHRDTAERVDELLWPDPHA